MEAIKKTRRAALILFAAVALALLWFAIDSVRSLALVTVRWNGPCIVAMVGILMVAATLVLALMTLYAVRAEQSPFIRKNVRRLKAMAVLLVVYEPYFLVTQAILNRGWPTMLEGGTAVTVHSSMGGVVFAAGLVVYCVSLVFQYGIALQQQYDETL